MTQNHEEHNVITNPHANTIENPNTAEVDGGTPMQRLEIENIREADGINKDPVHKIWQLITFFRRAFIYFTIIALVDAKQLILPHWATVIFKCLPVLTLCVFVYRQFNSYVALWRNKYSFLVFLGMNFSYIGDGLLVFQHNHSAFFLSGLVCFAIAHLLYTFAFGWKPFKSRMLLRSIIAFAVVYYYLYTGNLQNDEIGLIVGVACYVAIIMAMQWRAWARISFHDVKAGRYYEVLGAIGASFFALSDAILGVNKFRFPVPGEKYSVIATYYAGQMFIALSVVDGPNIMWPQDDVESNEEIDGIRQSFNHPANCIYESLRRTLDWFFT